MIKRILVSILLTSLVSSVELAFSLAESVSFAQEVSLAQDEVKPIRPAFVGVSGSRNSPVPAIDKDDSHFVTDTDQWLDRYLFRENVPDGKLTFHIAIDRYYSPLITPESVDQDGYLTQATAQRLVDKFLLPKTATLVLQVWDVDHNAEVCPEVDHIYVNDKKLTIADSSEAATLTSGNDTWSTWSISFPIELLKFPIAKGGDAQPPAAIQQQIALDINVNNCLRPNEPGTAWAVEVDWGAIVIESPIRPIVFAHGWTGDTSTFDDFESFAKEDGIPTAPQVDLQRGIYPIANTSPLLVRAIEAAAKEFGVDKVNIFAHSKGGLVTRDALNKSTTIVKMVDSLITFGSPHHGTDWSGIIDNIWFLGPCRDFSGDQRQRCIEASEEISVSRIRDEFNYTGCVREIEVIPIAGQPPVIIEKWTSCTLKHRAQPGVTYRTIEGGTGDVGDRTATYPWNADQAPFPLHGTVDAEFQSLNPFDSIPDLTHSEIKQDTSAYRCAISFLNAHIYPRTNCPNGQTIVTDARRASQNGTPIPVESEYEIFFKQSGEVESNTRTFSVQVDTGSAALFNLYTENPAEFSLIDPSGRVIDNATAVTIPEATYATQANALWGTLYWYQYRIDHPQAGLWQVLVAGNTRFALINAVDSTTRITSSTDHYTYQPDEMITLEVVAMDGTQAISSVAISGTLQNASDIAINMLNAASTMITTSIVFLDNGTVGDKTANDGIYTAQFIAPHLDGRYTVDLQVENNEFVRTAEHDFAIATQTAKVQSAAQASVIDQNHNGLYDVLNIPVIIEVLQSSDFEINGVIASANGQELATATYSTLIEEIGPLSPGRYTIYLSFDGKAIRQSAINGPYTLSNVTLFDQNNGSFVVDSATNLYTTMQSYQYDQFEGPLLGFIAASEVVTDTNQDGKYNELTILLNLDVILPGEYSWNGRLVDHSGIEIAWTVNSGTLDSQTPASFNFAGESIANHKVNGPYTLQDVSIFQITGGGAAMLLPEAHRTFAYSYLAFEGAMQTIYLPLISR